LENVETPQGWVIVGQEDGAKFLDVETAASHILGEQIKDTIDYKIERNGIVNVVRTYPEIIERTSRPVGE
jgi:hypothetical protein